MRRIAIYGKGGIGKSTISSNLTAALASAGQKVLQIGCDPKHDSTRLLTNGVPSLTVLEYLRNSKVESRRLQDVLVSGFGGCDCVEAGGPEPGVGCAGRGIISAFDLLDSLGVQELNHDIIVYDVLGDVVCGGFAVPLRNEYADTVYIVTSGEFMSLYAANNILRGVANYNPDRIGGIIFNSRGDEEESQRVIDFSKAVKIPIVAEIPRSPLFLDAERQGQTIVESYPQSELSGLFHSLASKVMNAKRYTASHLSEDELERVVLGQSRIMSSPQSVNAIPERNIPKNTPIFTSRNVQKGEILHGCAFSGAAAICMSVRGLTTVLHGPNGCAHLAYQLAANGTRRTFLRQGTLIRSFLDVDVHSTSMNESSMIFGGMEDLRETISTRLQTGSSTVAVITSCPSGIIGDDVIGTISSLKKLYPNKTIIPIIEDGNINGDHMQGVIDACIALSESLIDKKIAAEDGFVNLVGIKPIASNCQSNIAEASRLLSLLGLSINCRFIGDTDLDQIRNFRKGSLSILMNTDRFAYMLKDYLESKHGALFSNMPVRPGLKGTESWLKEVALATNREFQSESALASIRSEYETRLIQIKPFLKGRSVYVISMHKDIDWVVDLLLDLEMDIQRIRVLERADHSMDYDVENEHDDIIEFETAYDVQDIMQDVRRKMPDILLTTYLTRLDLPIHQFKVPLVPDIGPLGALEMAASWVMGLRAPLEEGWRKDVC